MESEIKTCNGTANELSREIKDDEILIADLNSANNTKTDEMSTVSRRSDEPSELSFEKGKTNVNFKILNLLNNIMFMVQACAYKHYSILYCFFFFSSRIL